MSRDIPDYSYDDESTAEYRIRDGNPVCVNNPTSIEARVVATKADFSSTGQTVSIDPENGFRCKNSENDPNCVDYEVRFCCTRK